MNKNNPDNPYNDLLDTAFIGVKNDTGDLTAKVSLEVMKISYLLNKMNSESVYDILLDPNFDDYDIICALMKNWCFIDEDIYAFRFPETVCEDYPDMCEDPVIPEGSIIIETKSLGDYTLFNIYTMVDRENDLEVEFQFGFIKDVIGENPVAYMARKIVVSLYDAWINFPGLYYLDHSDMRIKFDSDLEKNIPFI